MSGDSTTPTHCLGRSASVTIFRRPQELQFVLESACTNDLLGAVPSGRFRDLARDSPAGRRRRPSGYGGTLARQVGAQHRRGTTGLLFVPQLVGCFAVRAVRRPNSPPGICGLASAFWGACLCEGIGQPGISVRTLADNNQGVEQNGVLRSTMGGSRTTRISFTYKKASSEESVGNWRTQRWG
jgi:hypothetical protein